MPRKTTPSAALKRAPKEWVAVPSKEVAQAHLDMQHANEVAAIAFDTETHPAGQGDWPIAAALAGLSNAPAPKYGPDWGESAIGPLAAALAAGDKHHVPSKPANFGGFMSTGASMQQIPRREKWELEISWPTWNATSGAAMVAQDLLYEHEHQASALPLLRKIFPAATEADLAAMLAPPMPGEYVRHVGSVHDEIMVHTYRLDQETTDAAVESEVLRRIGQTKDCVVHYETWNVTRDRFITGMGAMGAGAAREVEIHGTMRLITTQHGGRHTSPVARAWFARIEVARRAAKDAFWQLMEECRKRIGAAVQLPDTILLPPATFQALAKETADDKLFQAMVMKQQAKASASLWPLMYSMLDASNTLQLAKAKGPRFMWLRHQLAIRLLPPR